MGLVCLGPVFGCADSDDAISDVTFFGSAESLDFPSGALRFKSIIDTADSSCSFSTETTTNGGRIEIKTAASPGSPAACTNADMCIQCTTYTTGSDCSINCTGRVPSNETTDADSFDVTVTYAVDFTTDASSPDGMIRFDGSIIDWAEFDPSDSQSQGQAPVYDITGCDGGGVMEVNTDDPLGINATTATTWMKSFKMVAIGDGTCTITTSLKAVMELTGAITPGASIDLTRGTITQTGRICDDRSNTTVCPAP